MFAYCNNNPLINCDSAGEDPVLIAAAGGAVAGGIISLYYYLRNTDDANFGGALLSMTGGALAGALGGAASMLTGNPQFACVLGATVVAGLMADVTGGSFAIGSLAALGGTYLGLQIDISMFSGIELMFASFLASIGVGYPAEMASQSMHDDLKTYQSTTGTKDTNSTGNGAQKATNTGGTNGQFRGGGAHQTNICSCMY